MRLLTNGLLSIATNELVNQYPESSSKVNYDKWLHRYIILVTVVTGILIYAGGLVTTLGAGLAVPDWPLSFGSLNPTGWWRQPMVREEHGHRLIGAVVGVLTLILCCWLSVKGRVRWHRALGFIALVAVIIQGVLGGLRVIDRNIYFAMIHACLAQVFFCILITLAWGTSLPWQSQRINRVASRRFDKILAMIICIAVFLQLIIGAVMRHSGAGMAIPTFPLVFEGIFPPIWNFKIAIHYAHRVWALAILIGVTIFYAKSIRCFSFWPRLMALLTLIFTLVQITLGGITIMTGRAVLPTTSHVVVGALILASSLSCVLWLFHFKSTQTISPESLCR